MFRFPARLTRGLGVLSLVGATAVAGACAPGISPQEEAQLGAQYASEINRQLPIVEDAQINSYLNELGNQLVPDDPDYPDFRYRFFMVNAEQINAFAVPGGYIYINRGLVDRTENLSELAGVLGHEIAHVTRRHGVEQMARAQQAELAVNVAYILLGRQPGAIEQVGVQAAGAAYFASHSRSAEREADDLAVVYTRQAGINPDGIVTFLEKLMEDRDRRPGLVEGWFATHPTTADRVEATRQRVEEIPAAERRNMTTDTQQYQQFKARVAALPQPPRQ